MTAIPASGPDVPEPIFSAVLTPYRSLSPTGFMLVMLLLVACSFTAGFIFWLRGAWPVVGFFGLDILLVQFAFRMNYRSARRAEEIEVTGQALTVRAIAPSGRATERSFNPYWARLQVDRTSGIGVTRLSIASHGKRFDIASFLGPRERESFAAALSAALAKARAGAA